MKLNEIMTDDVHDEVHEILEFVINVMRGYGTSNDEIMRYVMRVLESD